MQRLLVSREVIWCQPLKIPRGCKGWWDKELSPQKLSGWWLHLVQAHPCLVYLWESPSHHQQPANPFKNAACKKSLWTHWGPSSHGNGERTYGTWQLSLLAFLAVYAPDLCLRAGVRHSFKKRPETTNVQTPLEPFLFKLASNPCSKSDQISTTVKTCE